MSSDSPTTSVGLIASCSSTHTFLCCGFGKPCAMGHLSMTYYRWTIHIWRLSKRLVKQTAFRSLRSSRASLFTSTQYNARQLRKLLGVSARVVEFGCGQLRDRREDRRFRHPFLSAHRSSSMSARSNHAKSPLLGGRVRECRASPTPRPGSRDHRWRPRVDRLALERRIADPCSAIGFAS